MHFRQCITFHPNNLVRLRLCQHLQDAQVDSICKMQLRPSDIVENMQNMTYDLTWKI